MSRLKLLIILIACVSLHGCEDISDFFEHAFDEFDEVYCGVYVYDARINQTSDGKYIVVGSRLTTPKTYPIIGVINKDGEQELSHMYKFDTHVEALAATDISNDYLLAGKIRKNSIEEYHQFDLYVARIEKSGNMLWDKRYDIDPTVKDVEIFKLPDNQFMIVTSMWRYTSGTNVSIIDENGELLDSTNYTYYFPSIIQTSSGGFAYVSDSMLCQTDKDFAILNQWKTNTKYARLCQVGNGFAYVSRDSLAYIDGNGINNWTIGFPVNVVCTNIISKEESIYTFGTKYIPDTYGDDYISENYIAEFDLHGNLLKEYDPKIGSLRDVVLDSDQRIILLYLSGSCLYLEELK